MLDFFLYYVQALPVLAYWLTLVLIGYAALHAGRRYFDKAWLPDVRSNPFFSALVSFATGVLLLSVGSLIGYIFKLPSAVFTLLWAVAAIGVVAWLAPKAVRLLSVRKTLRVGGYRFWALATIAVGSVVLLAVDYIVSTYFGAQFAEGSDSYVHVAKIMSIAVYGFSLDDGFLAGVLETRYHFNAVYPLYLPIVHLLNISPADAWNLSTGFFRLMQWIAIGALAGFIYSRTIKAGRLPVWTFSSIAMVVAIVLFNSKWYLHVAMYPNKVVILWFILLIIGLMLYVSRLQKERAAGVALLLGSSVLITLTHPTYALMAAVFIFAVTLVLLAGWWLRWWKWAWRNTYGMAGAFAILMVAPLVAVAFPDRMTQGSFDYGDFRTATVFGVEVLSVYVPTTPLAITMALITTLGYGAMLYWTWKRREYRVLVVLSILITFAFLTVHNPLFMAIVGGQLPLWLIARFGAMNVLLFIVTVFGVYTIYKAALDSKLEQRIKGALLTVISAAAVVMLVINYTHGYRTLYDATKGIDHGYLAFIHRTQDELTGVMPAGALVFANIGDSYFLPAAIPVKVVAIHEAHATPMADSEHRLICSQEILETGYDTKLLATVGARYIVLAKWEATFPELIGTLRANPQDFSFVKETSDFFVYQVNERVSGGALKEGSCYEYQFNEGTIQ